MEKELNIEDVREELRDCNDICDYDVVGESHYDIGSLVDSKDVRNFQVECLLLREDNNPFDKNAVSVHVKKGDVFKQVGYLSREEAKLFRKLLKRKQADAVLTDGYITGHEGLYGVSFELPYDLSDYALSDKELQMLKEIDRKVKEELDKGR